MKKLFSVLSLLVLSTSLMGCSNWDKRDTGTAVGGVGGAVVGGLVSHTPLGVAVGAVGGAVIGNQLSK